MPNRIMAARMEHDLDVNLKQCCNVNLSPCGVGWSVCGVDLAPGQGLDSGRSNKMSGYMIMLDCHWRMST